MPKWRLAPNTLPRESTMNSFRQRVIPCLAVGVLLSSGPLSAMAEKLTIDLIFGEKSLSGLTPRGVKISPDGRRVGFLRGRDADQFQLDLWVYDVDHHSIRLLVDSQKLLPEERLSDAERARRERARTAALHGILEYEWAPDGRQLLFRLGDALYLYDLRARSETAIRKVVAGAGLLDAKISPKGRYVSFLRDQNLFVRELATGAERQLTVDGGGTVHNAEAEFVAQEEMDQQSGYWWASDDSTIAFKQYDESPVPPVRRFEVYPDRTEVIEQRYPAAGDSNVVVRLGLVRPTGGAVRWIDLGPNTDIYLPRVDWLPDGRVVSFQRQSRDQKRLDLIAVDVATLTQKTLLTESSRTWINLHADLRFLKKQPAFIWSSERTGYSHLYLYGLDGTLIRPLTGGDWNVDEALAVDESSGWIYISSNRDAVIDKQIYTVRIEGDASQAPVRVSAGDGWHGAAFARDAEKVSLYVDTYSNPLTPPQTSIRGPDGRWLAWIEENKLDETHPYWPYREALAVPEFGVLPAEDGQALEYRVCKPQNFDPTRRYPVFMTVYGGPGGQEVTRGWGDLFDQYMTQQGYVVFTLDNRGTPRRGRRFSDAIHGRLGDIEVRDQLVGVRWLKQQSFVDPARIGVFGWSYGGYMTLMMLAKASSELAAGVAVAPVTDWRAYDTHYTERYLSTPQVNAVGYDSSAVFGSLGDLTSPLLLVHGMADDNVLFVNSTQLMAALQAHGTQFQLMTYPGGKHGLSDPAMRKHAYHLIANFLDERLKPREESR
jgi:dipeptidyl-peptidase 4